MLYKKAGIDFCIASFATDKYGMKSSNDSLKKIIESNKIVESFKNI